jgi:hypothetical protein
VAEIESKQDGTGRFEMDAEGGKIIGGDFGRRRDWRRYRR